MKSRVRPREAHILGAPLFPQSVKFLIGAFPDLFGTTNGRLLQQLAARNGWALVWALGSNLPSDDMNFCEQSHKTNRRQLRILLRPSFNSVRPPSQRDLLCSVSVSQKGLFADGPENQTQFAGNRRLLDPEVLPHSSISNNLTLPDGYAARFVKTWDAAASSRKASPGGTVLEPGQWTEWFAELAAGATDVDVQPLRPRACASADRCIGTNAAGACVCYSE